MRRQKRSREFWERLIADFEASGKTQGEFARRRGVAESSIQRWRTRLHKERDQDGGGFSFVELKTDDGKPPVEIALQGGIVIRFGQVADAALIAAVVKRIVATGC